MAGSPSSFSSQFQQPQGTSASNNTSSSSQHLKAKKSLDWLPKSFKRSKASTSTSPSLPPSSSPRSSFRTTRHDGASTSSAHTRSNGSSNSDTPLTVIPGSPRETTSLSSNEEKSAGEHSSAPSQPSPGLPVTPEDIQFQTLRVSPLPSPLGVHAETAAQDYMSSPKKSAAATPTTSGRPNSSAGRSSQERQPNDYEKLVLSLSSRKALRTMLDE